MWIFILAFTFLSYPALAQKLLFDEPERLELVKKSSDHIYNMEFELSQVYIDSLSVKIPNHPINHLLKAVSVMYKEMPFSYNSPNFPDFEEHLIKAKNNSDILRDSDDTYVEGVYFGIASSGLLAQYYSDGGQYFKALSEGRSVYYLIKKAMKMVEENDVFHFPVGLYNYFREVYPELHPIYKSFVWIFKRGDRNLGLKQIEYSCEKAIFSRVESHLYYAYILLRYENRPEKAIGYLKVLHYAYPKNPYFRAKLTEGLILTEQYIEAAKHIGPLQVMNDPYYKMAGYIMEGIIFEKDKKQYNHAVNVYSEGLSAFYSETKGTYYRSLAYLGLGRIFMLKKDDEVAKEYLKLTLKFAETASVEEEAKSLLKLL